ncbi:hypothetical protein FB1_14520 [Flavobacterium branchiophilum NBRC 15030 = ATCC 35035]|nr:hypothetical protein FB1_14520 [Flavobacterium branchiophilum NBRC 15030 = ATCC 35035]
MQAAYFEVLQTIIEHLDLPGTGHYIIGGCQALDPTGITNGMLYIDGDVCPFLGTATGGGATKISKIITTEEAAFKNGLNHTVYYNYVALVNDNGTALADFERVPTVNEIKTKEVILANQIAQCSEALNIISQKMVTIESKTAVFMAGGGMVLWNKPANEIPQGWQEVVDWRGRMPVGVDIAVDGSGAFINPEFSPINNGTGRTGGTKTHVLSMEEMPKHNHNVAVFANGSASGNADGHPDNQIDPNRKIASDYTGGQPDGTTKAFSVLNPYRTVYFIEYTGT